MSKHPFAPGDVVECVDAGRRQFGGYIGLGTGLKAGRLYRVVAIGFHPIAKHPVIFVGAHSEGSAVERFRHISDENDAETIARIKSCKAPSDRSKVIA